MPIHNKLCSANKYTALALAGGEEDPGGGDDPQPGLLDQRADQARAHLIPGPQPVQHPDLV